MDRIKKHWQSALTAALALFSLAGGCALAYAQLDGPDHCCQPGASCCHAGSACCSPRHEHTPRP